MKYESSISSSFPFNKTSVHFISERRLNLNYFDFSWPNFGECYQTWKQRPFPASSMGIKRSSLCLWVLLWIFLSCYVGLLSEQWRLAARYIVILAPFLNEVIYRKRKSTEGPMEDFFFFPGDRRKQDSLWWGGIWSHIWC